MAKIGTMRSRIPFLALLCAASLVGAVTLSIPDFEVDPGAAGLVQRKDAAFLVGRVRQVATRLQPGWKIGAAKDGRQPDLRVLGEISVFMPGQPHLSLRFLDARRRILVHRTEIEARDARELRELADSAARDLLEDFSSMEDPRDGHVYLAVKIGTRRWMEQNLDHKTDSSWCYESADENCRRYGRLYRWEAAAKACPKGWHLPDEKEWNELLATCPEGRGHRASGDPFDWQRPFKSSAWNGTDSCGFGALPAGYRSERGEFESIGSWVQFPSRTLAACRADGSHCGNEPEPLAIEFLDGGAVAGLQAMNAARAASVRCVEAPRP
jgi:uncharacterized protein (TIGR02145 family)